MTDTTNETQVEVTQADRDAAAGYEKKYPAEDNPFAFEMERGDADSTPLVQAFARHRIQAEKRNNALAVELRTTLNDALAGWRYIRANHGDLYGVGWDRVENRLNSALAALEGDE